jgi:hypothetical protein
MLPVLAIAVFTVTFTVTAVGPAAAKPKHHKKKKHKKKHHKHHGSGTTQPSTGPGTNPAGPAALDSPPVGKYECYTNNSFTDPYGGYYFGFVDIKSSTAYDLNGSLTGTYHMASAEQNGWKPIVFDSGVLKDYNWSGYWRMFQEGNGTQTPQIQLDGRAVGDGVQWCDKI